MNKSSVSCTQRSAYSQIVYGVLERRTWTHNQIMHGETDWRFKVHQNTELRTELMVSQWNSSGISSQDSPHCSSSTKVQQSLSSLSVTPEKFTGRIKFMSMFNDISCWSRDNEEEFGSNAQLVSLYAKRFGAGQWSFLGSGYTISEDSPKGEWDRIAEQMMLTFAESKHIILRTTSPLSRGVLKSKGGAKLSIHYCADPGTHLFPFISSVFTEQSKICVKNTKLFTIERRDLFWKDNPTHCSCQVWWRQTYFWLMIMHKQKIYCGDLENELKSYHDTIEWVNSVLYWCRIPDCC